MWIFCMCILVTLVFYFMYAVDMRGVLGLWFLNVLHGCNVVGEWFREHM